MKLHFKMHPAGWIFFALLLVAMPAAQLVAVLAALLVHEAGHLLVMVLCRIRECRIEITPFGGLADVPGYDELPVWKRILCALGGPLASAMGAAACFLPCIQGGFRLYFFHCNVLMALLNLLPVFPLDGARVLVAAGEKIGAECFLCRATRAAAYVFALFLFVLGIMGIFRGRVNLSLFLLPPYLCYTAYQSALYTRLRKMGRCLAGKDFPEGEIRPVKAFVSSGQPHRMEMLRHVQNRNPNVQSILYICDGPTGVIQEILTTKQICHKLISE